MGRSPLEGVQNLTEVPTMMAHAVCEGRLFWLKTSEWSVLLVSVALCGFLTLFSDRIHCSLQRPAVAVEGSEPRRTASSSQEQPRWGFRCRASLAPPGFAFLCFVCARAIYRSKVAPPPFEAIWSQASSLVRPRQVDE
jgi:hypothetical protein